MPVHSYPRSRGVAGLALVVLVAASCAGVATSTSTATSAPPAATITSSTGQAGVGTDPCALVTSAEAGAAIGVQVATTKRKDDGGYHVCEYVGADARYNLVVTLIDRVGDGTDKTAFDLAYGGQPVTGVGSDARFDADLSALAVLQNGTVIDVSMSDEGRATGAQIQAALTKVALIALGRL